MNEKNDNQMTDMLEERLKINLERKAQIGDTFFKGGVPTDPKEIRLYLEVTRDEEATMLELKKQQQEAEKNANDEGYKLAIVSALKEIKKNRVDVTLSEELPEDIVKDIEILDTELNMEQETLALEDFVEED